MITIDQNKLNQLNKEKRIQKIKNLLTEIDIKTVRPLRAGEMERVAELEANAQTLRNELALLLEE